MLKVESKQKGSKFHMLEIVAGNILFLTNMKKTKETKIFLLLALLVSLPKMLS